MNSSEPEEDRVTEEAVDMFGFWVEGILLVRRIIRTTLKNYFTCLILYKILEIEELQAGTGSATTYLYDRCGWFC